MEGRVSSRVEVFFVHRTMQIDGIYKGGQVPDCTQMTVTDGERDSLSCDSRELSGMRTADLHWMYGDKRGRTATKKSQESLHGRSDDHQLAQMPLVKERSIRGLYTHDDRHLASLGAS